MKQDRNKLFSDSLTHYNRVILIEPLFKTKAHYIRLWNSYGLWIPKNSVLGSFLKENPHKLTEVPWRVIDETDHLGEKTENFNKDGVAEYIIASSWKNLKEDNIKLEFDDVWIETINSLSAFESISKVQNDIKTFVDSKINSTKRP